ncbi:MAG TPA: alpha/beta hydrolase-fold protein [Sphingomicrobium sp.]|nr:alpha/beta hydrolase-fold protein [Sphingomicrobium sp.]
MLGLAGAGLVTGCTTTPSSPAPPATVPLDHLPALKGDYFPLQSREADHLYHIYVRLPEGYDSEPDRHYPVVYLLDGDSAFPYLAPHHLFLTYDDKIPEAILVGIAYGSFAQPTNRRHIDFMPPAVGVESSESGAAAFQQFLRSELLPTVEQRYRADPIRRILVGQSRAGAFVLYSAFTDPDLFWSRLASNPSMHPGREIIFGNARAGTRRDLRLFLATGTAEAAGRRGAALEWLAYWQQRQGAPWTAEKIEIDGGTHAANLPDAYREMLRRLFSSQATSRAP